MSASIREIAKEAGVTHATVSRLFRGDPQLRISDRRREDIFAARDRLGGVKVRLATLSHTIFSPVNGVITPQDARNATLQHPSYRAFELELKSRGFNLHIEKVSEQEICRRVMEWLPRRGRPDGLLIQNSYGTEELAQLLRRYAIPHVTNDFALEHLQINTVCHHATAGMRQAVEHLAKLGHRQIAFAGVSRQHRYPMMASAMIALGLAVDPAANFEVELPHQPRNHEIRQCSAEGFDDWRRRNPGVTALVCSNDYVALGVADAMLRAGLTPGRELSLIGYDNIEEQYPAPGHRPILTTINNPFERVGRRMAELLLNQILHGQTAIIHERVPVSLIVRQTTGIPVTG